MATNPAPSMQAAPQAQAMEAMDAMDTMAQEGRVTDDVMAHLTTGEIVVPVHIAQNKQAVAMLTMMFELAGADIDEFTVGNVKNKINPETGHPEFWGGFFGNIVSNVVNTGKAVVNTVATVGQDLLNLNPVAAVKDTVVGAKSVLSNAVTTVATAATDIGLAPKPQAPKQPGPAATSDTTLTQNQELRNTSLTDPAAVGGGGVSSTSNRTVAGPDSDYKLNKNTMIGL